MDDRLTAKLQKTSLFLAIKLWRLKSLNCIIRRFCWMIFAIFELQHFSSCENCWVLFNEYSSLFEPPVSDGQMKVITRGIRHFFVIKKSIDDRNHNPSSLRIFINQPSEFRAKCYLVILVIYFCYSIPNGVHSL